MYMTSYDVCTAISEMYRYGETTRTLPCVRQWHTWFTCELCCVEYGPKLLLVVAWLALCVNQHGMCAASCRRAVRLSPVTRATHSRARNTSGFISTTSAPSRPSRVSPNRCVLRNAAARCTSSINTNWFGLHKQIKPLEWHKNRLL